jgi:hypothetical protein
MLKRPSASRTALQIAMAIGIAFFACMLALMTAIYFWPD